LITFIITEKDV